MTCVYELIENIYSILSRAIISVINRTAYYRSYYSNHSISKEHLRCIHLFTLLCRLLRFGLCAGYPKDLNKQFLKEPSSFPDGQDTAQGDCSKHPNERDDHPCDEEPFREDVVAQEHRNRNKEVHNE